MSFPLEVHILGVDPGSHVTGFGLIRWRQGSLKLVDYGVLRLKDKQGDPAEQLAFRLSQLSRDLEHLLLKFRPHSVVVENIFLGKNAQSAFKLGHARGVVFSEAAQFNCKVVEYATRLVKKGITGSGSADKEQVNAVLCSLLQISKIEPWDASDALAMAYYHGLELNRLRVLGQLHDESKILVEIK